MICGCCGKEADTEICEPYCLPCSLHHDWMKQEWERKNKGAE